LQTASFLRTVASEEEIINYQFYFIIYLFILTGTYLLPNHVAISPDKNLSTYTTIHSRPVRTTAPLVPTEMKWFSIPLSTNLKMLKP
jgi:hypothetical protein